MSPRAFELPGDGVMLTSSAVTDAYLESVVGAGAGSSPAAADASEFSACRECSEKKHGACNGTALVDDGQDVLEVDCLCAAADHFGEGA